MRRDKDPQIERLIAVGILVALHRIDALGLESPGQEIGDLAHKEIAERAAKDANLDAATPQRRRALGHTSVGRRAASGSAARPVSRHPSAPTGAPRPAGW